MYVCNGDFNGLLERLAFFIGGFQWPRPLFKISIAVLYLHRLLAANQNSFLFRKIPAPNIDLQYLGCSSFPRPSSEIVAVPADGLSFLTLQTKAGV